MEKEAFHHPETPSTHHPDSAGSNATYHSQTQPNYQIDNIQNDLMMQFLSQQYQTIPVNIIQNQFYQPQMYTQQNQKYEQKIEPNQQQSYGISSTQQQLEKEEKMQNELNDNLKLMVDEIDYYKQKPLENFLKSMEEKIVFIDRDVYVRLFDKYRQTKKTKEEKIKFIMRKCFKFMKSKIETNAQNKDIIDDIFRDKYFNNPSEGTLLTESEIDLMPFKKDSQVKTMNMKFLKFLFQSSKFVEDYFEYLENFDDLAQKENDKKIEKCVQNQLKSYRRLPWTKMWLQDTKDLAKKLVKQYRGDIEKFYSHPNYIQYQRKEEEIKNTQVLEKKVKIAQDELQSTSQQQLKQQDEDLQNPEIISNTIQLNLDNQMNGQKCSYVKEESQYQNEQYHDLFNQTYPIISKPNNNATDKQQKVDSTQQQNQNQQVETPQNESKVPPLQFDEIVIPNSNYSGCKEDNFNIMNFNKNIFQNTPFNIPNFGSSHNLGFLGFPSTHSLDQGQNCFSFQPCTQQQNQQQQQQSFSLNSNYQMGNVYQQEGNGKYTKSMSSTSNGFQNIPENQHAQQQQQSSQQYSQQQQQNQTQGQQSSNQQQPSSTITNNNNNNNIINNYPHIVSQQNQYSVFNQDQMYQMMLTQSQTQQQQQLNYQQKNIQQENFNEGQLIKQQQQMPQKQIQQNQFQQIQLPSPQLQQQQQIQQQSQQQDGFYLPIQQNGQYQKNLLYGEEEDEEDIFQKK